jgi:hypothetical protein
MNFFQSLWHRITRQELIDTLYQTINNNLQTIEELNSQEQEYKNTILEKEKLLKSYADLIADKDISIEDLYREIDTIRKEENIYPEPNLQVDWDRFPYFGKTVFSYYDLTTKKIVDTEIQMTPSKYYKIWSDEMYQYVISGMKGYTKKTEFEKVVKLRDLVCDKITYQFDTNSEGFKIDNWKLPIQTFANKKDDCDGMTSLWLTFCNIYGIQSNKVFNLTGTVPQGGHSFGGYLDQDNQMWVIECTSKKKPFLMKGSKYKCNTRISGITNWAFAGVPKVEQF